MYGLNNCKMDAHVQRPIKEAPNVVLNLDQVSRTPQHATLKSMLSQRDCSASPNKGHGSPMSNHTGV